MDTASWPQEIVVKPMEDMLTNGNTCSSSTPNIFSNNGNSNGNTNPNDNNNNNSSKVSSTAIERKVRPEKDQALNCPRCNSTNTKFCYYNNYSLTQPRYFCKTCRRYWTEGGSLRNIPVGGGSRKNKRSLSTSSSSPPSNSHKKILSHDHPHLLNHLQNPSENSNRINGLMEAHDLNLGFPQPHQDQFRSLSEFIQLPNLEPNPGNKSGDHGSSTNGSLSALELLNGLTSSTRGLTPFMPVPVPDPNGVYSSGLMSLHEFKPTLNFSLDGFGTLSNGVQQHQETGDNNGRLLFPFEDCSNNNKTVSNNTTTTTSPDHDNNGNTGNDHQARDQGDSSGYWTGMLGTTGSW